MLLDHITIVTSDPDRTAAFLDAVLGIKPGPRPPFDFPGYWLYEGDRAIVHLVGGRAPTPGAGPYDHAAFRRDDYPAFKQRLVAAGIPFGEQSLPGYGDRQIFVRGPGGERIEIVFPPEQAGSA